MKVITLVTTIARDSKGIETSTPPGVVDLPDADAKALLMRGQAKRITDAAIKEIGPTVKVGVDAKAAIQQANKLDAERKAENKANDSKSSENKNTDNPDQKK